MVRPGGAEVDVPIEQVQLGDIVVVRAGEKVATDGRITEGQSSLDAITVKGGYTPDIIEVKHGEPVQLSF